MQNGKQERMQELWKSQAEEAIPMSAEAICARAQRYERENVVVHWTMQMLTPLIAAFAFYRLYGLVFLKNYLLVATFGWLLATFFYFIWKFFQKGVRRPNAGEPCADFLKREFNGKREFAQMTRQLILYLVPAVFIAWWAGGPALTAKEFGIHVSWIAVRHAPVPLIITLFALACIWGAMGDIRRKAEKELEQLKEQGK